MATIDVLEEPETYPYLNRITSKLKNGFNDLFQRMGFEAIASGPGSTFNLVFAKEIAHSYRDCMHFDAKLRMQLDYGLLARGIHFHPDKPFYTCTQHTDEDVERTLAASEEVLRKMKSSK
jgi:glutamate-1-semialdehyde 2,1-aminomutase